MSQLLGNKTRKQHWIPQFYLRYFADSAGRLQVYRVEGDRFFATGTEGVCAERDLYEVEYTAEDSSDSDRFYLPNFIEKKLSKMEDELAAAYVQLLDCVAKEEFGSGRFDAGRLAICSLAANFIVRHPEVMCADLEDVSEFALKFKNSNQFNATELAVLEESDWRGDYSALMKLAAQSALLFSNDEAVPRTKICRALAQKRLTVLKAPVGMRFVTTSMPLFVTGPDDDSYDFDTAYMPLSSTYAAFFSNLMTLPIYMRLDVSEVMLLNRLLLLSCPHLDLAIASARGPLELAVRDCKLASTRN